MKTKLLSTIIFTLSLQIAIAQDAADFTFTDYLGNAHTLYADYLDQGKTVMLKVFYTSCPPCNQIAPHLEPLYQEWGAGEYDVQFIELSDKSFDDNSRIQDYKDKHGTTFPTGGADGGSVEAVAPYKSGDYGQFFGTPTFIVISPDRTVDFDIFGFGTSGQIQALDEAIAATGAVKPVISSNEELSLEADQVSINPNPVKDLFQVSFELSTPGSLTMEVFNILGAKVQEIAMGYYEPGPQSFGHNIQELKSGSYIIRIIKNDRPLKSLRLIKE